eukprot:SM000180S03521  [mRNA]  locus=s180:153453:155675:- [translate_table: standard]
MAPAAEYAALPRRRLQALCKRRGLRANGSNKDMAAALAALATEVTPRNPPSSFLWKPAHVHCRDGYMRGAKDLANTKWPPHVTPLLGQTPFADEEPAAASPASSSMDVQEGNEAVTRPDGNEAANSGQPMPTGLPASTSSNVSEGPGRARRDDAAEFGEAPMLVSPAEACARQALRHTPPGDPPEMDVRSTLQAEGERLQVAPELPAKTEVNVACSDFVYWRLPLPSAAYKEAAEATGTLLSAPWSLFISQHAFQLCRQAGVSEVPQSKSSGGLVELLEKWREEEECSRTRSESSHKDKYKRLPFSVRLSVERALHLAVRQGASQRAAVLASRRASRPQEDEAALEPASHETTSGPGQAAPEPFLPLQLLREEEDRGSHEAQVGSWRYFPKRLPFAQRDKRLQQTVVQAKLVSSTRRASTLAARRQQDVADPTYQSSTARNSGQAGSIGTAPDSDVGELCAGDAAQTGSSDHDKELRHALDQARNAQNGGLAPGEGANKNCARDRLEIADGQALLSSQRAGLSMACKSDLPGNRIRKSSSIDI